MIELRCTNCGSTELFKQDGEYVCTACGARFLPEHPTKAAKIEQYRDLMISAMQNSEYEEQKEYMWRILEIDPTDPYGWAGKVYMYITLGLDEYSAECVDAMKKTMEYMERYATEEEKDDLKDFLTHHIRLYAERIIENVPSEGDNVRKMQEFLGIC